MLAMVISFSKNIKPGLVIAYAGLEGLALGTLSSYYESFYPGILQFLGETAPMLRYEANFVGCCHFRTIIYNGLQFILLIRSNAMNIINE